jgi:hypothetical protein
MSLREWKNNIQLLENIIDETIEDENITNYNTIVKNEFYQLVSKYNNVRLDYDSYDDINREILMNINNRIQSLKEQLLQEDVKNSVTQINNNNVFKPPMGRDQGQPNYTKEQLSIERQNEFDNRLQKIQEEFQNTNVVKPPEIIDFSDKQQDNPADIDSLMEREMMNRQYELQQMSSSFNNKKEAEKWINNPSPSSSSDLNIKINNNDLFKQNEKINIMNEASNQGKEKLKSILKKVKFEDKKQNNTDELLEKLQQERMKIAPDIIPNTHSKLTPPTTLSTNIKDKQETKENNIQLEKQEQQKQIPKQYIQQPSTYQNKFNYLLINKKCDFKKKIRFVKDDLFISLNNLKSMTLNIYNNNNLVHSSLVYRSFEKQSKNNYYYRLSNPYIGEINSSFDFKLFDVKKNELIISLNKTLLIDHILNKDIQHYQLMIDGKPYENLDYENTTLLIVYNNEHELLKSLTDYTLYIGNEMLQDFIPLVVNDVERRENKMILDVKELYDNELFNYLIIDKKYKEKIEKYNEIRIKSNLLYNLLEN